MKEKEKPKTEFELLEENVLKQEQERIRREENEKEQTPESKMNRDSEWQKKEREEKEDSYLKELEDKKLKEKMADKNRKIKIGSQDKILKKAFENKERKEFLNPEEVSKSLSINIIEVLDLIESGKLQVSKNEDTGELLIHQKDLAEYLRNPEKAGQPSWGI